MSEARILIVEDNDEVAQMLVLFLSARGLQVTVAADGAQARQAIREFLPKLMLLDVGLPDMDGYELLRDFRASARTRHVPAIFLTQRNRKADRIAGLTLGADDFITKPFDLEELYLRIQNAVRRAERDNLSDPHTGLPTVRIVQEEVANARGRPDRAALELRLRHSGEFRDRYGALAAADVLRYTALLLNQLLNAVGGPDDFLGQLDDQTFVIITAPERADILSRTVVERFNSDVVRHYALAEREGGNVRVRDASGKTHLMPLMTLEAALVR